MGSDSSPSSSWNLGRSGRRVVISQVAVRYLGQRGKLLRPGLEVRTLSGILGHRYPKGGVEGCSTSVPSSDNRF